MKPLLRDPREDPWQERFAFLWYNDREIFEFTDADFAETASRFADAGINHLITFSCTHFRWSFRPWWPMLNEVLSRAVEACHSHEIAVTEHHSSHLTFNPRDSEEEDYMERILVKRQSSLASWPGLRWYCDQDSAIGECKLSDFRQIDGRTGEWARSSYHGYAMCFNNPHYRAAYLAYLDTVYATGVDGIMTDDVQYFAIDSWQRPGNACACVYCRQLFAEETGFELPSPGQEWAHWFGNYDQESFLRWIEFRQQSILRFHQMVVDHYEGKGLALLRPNYVSGAINVNPTAYALDTLPRLDWVFQENCFSHVIRYSWPHWAVEATHRTAVSEIRGIPAMSMFYPDRRDLTCFAWSLAMSWGELYLGTAEGESDPEIEAPLREFERGHRDALQRTRRIADVLFYDSRRNRTLYADAAETTVPELFTWAQACYFQNVPFALLPREDLNCEWNSPVLVLNHLAVWDEGETEAFRKYISRGGTIVRTGDELPDPPVACETGRKFPHHVLSAVSVDRWKKDGTELSKASVDPGDPSDIADYIRSLVGDRWQYRTSGIPNGIVLTGFRASNLPGFAFHLVDTRGCLDMPPAGMSHEDPIPEFEPPDLDGASIEIRIPLMSGPGAQVVSAIASTIGPDHSEARVPLSLDEAGEGQVAVSLAGLTLRRYTLIEVATRASD